ncbi:sensor histidine kinase [Chitinimonas naiadis]
MPAPRRGITTSVFFCLGLCVAISLLLISEQAHKRLAQVNQEFIESVEAKGLLRELYGAVSESQAGIRGYYITRRTEYLRARFMAANRMDQIMKRLEEIWRDSNQQRARLQTLRGLITREIAILNDTQATFDKEGRQAAVTVDGVNLSFDMGQTIKREIEATLANEADHYRERVWSWQSSVTSNRIGIWIISAVNVTLLLLLFIRARHERQRDVEAEQSSATRQAILEQEVAQRTLLLSELASSLQLEQEREKGRIAKEIRSSLGELVINARMLSNKLLTQPEQDSTQRAESLRQIIQQLDRSLVIKQQMIEELHPSALDRKDLVSALQSYVEQVCQSQHITAILTLPEALPDIPEEVSIAFFRISQQALSNILKYAKADHLWLTLKDTGDGWQLRIEDNGIGFTDAALSNTASHGMARMNQRAIILLGSFEVSARNEGGTVLDIWLPRQRLVFRSFS